MEKLFNIDVYQALSYLMPGLALLIPIYFGSSDWINSALQKIGSITAIAIVIPVALSVGIFLHAASIPVQLSIEKVSGHHMMESAVRQFEYCELLKRRLEARYGITIPLNEIGRIFIYSRTMTAKDAEALHKQAQFFSSLSVFCRSLIIVTWILGATAIVAFRRNKYRVASSMAALIGITTMLWYFKELYFRLSIQEILRAALLLTAPTG